MSASSAVQSNQYWEQFFVIPADVDHLVNFLVESERPQTLSALVQELIAYRHQKMVDLLKDTLSQGRVYRPAESYEVGETIVFPHLKNSLGEVVAVRPGRNPEHEPFSVIKVKMSEGRGREFVAELEHEHPLNTVSYLPSEDVATEDLVAQYSGHVREALLTTLETSAQFLSVADQWFLRDLVMDVSAGQLNIAEALLDMADGGPLETQAFLAEMEFPDEISKSLQIFSLEYALLRDKRFDEVGPSGKGMWYLRRMEPKQVLETPVTLRYMPVPYNRGLLDDVMLALERQMDDEWSEAPHEEAPEESLTVVLTYPHWRSGTLPLGSRVVKLFPTARITDRIRFTFVDADTKQEFPGWVVRSGRYVYGLADWYAKHGIVVGTYIDLARGDEPGKIEVAVRKFRSQRREWLRTVTVEDGALAFEVTRVPVVCEFDELAAVAVPDPDSLDALAEDLQRTSLESLLDMAFDGLAGLSLQRAVHALTLYSVLNLVRRVAPEPVLTILATSSKYNSLGDNYWAYRGENS